ncbi:MAG: hypothetical protein KA138_02230 [Saprospiraceae bacterium]|nr:hypothetical protein [Saprospiraceae bacterium]
MPSTILPNFLIHDNPEFRDRVNDSTEYMRPLEDPLINANLQVNNIQSVDEYLDYHNLKEAKRIFDKIEDTFRPSGMNPHKPYEPNIYFKDNRVYSVILDQIKKIISEESKVRCILHIGNKGSGKTMSQNIFLYRNHDYLEENNVLWVRCDVHKLYYLWRNHIDIDKLGDAVAIRDYFHIQLVYVFAKYHTKSNLLNKIFQEIKESNASYEFQIDHVGYQHSIKRVYESIIKYHENILRKESNNPQYDYSYAIEEIMIPAQKSDKKRSFKQWIDLSKAIQSFLYQKGYKLLLIIDGLDNINLSNASGLKYYHEMLNKFANFISERPNNGQFHLASMRNRTKNELNTLIAETTNSREYLSQSEFINIEQEKYDMTLLGSILEERLNYTFGKIKGSGTQHSEFIKKLCDVIIKTDSNKSTDDNYHENCRNYLNSKMNILKFVYYRWLEDGENPSYPIEEIYKRLYDQSLILNGRLYYNSEEKFFLTSDHGNYSFNIFHFQSREGRINLDFAKWPGLFCTRILQFLNNEKLTNPTFEILNNYFSKHFKYPSESLEYYIEKLRDYGLVDSLLAFSGRNERTQIVFKISSKGKFLLDKIYSSLEILYYYSLDTALPVKIIDKKYIDSHKLNSDKTEFHFNCIKNSLTFLKFLQLVEESERKYFLSSTTHANEEEYKSTFELPIKKNIDKYQKSIQSWTHFLSDEQIKLLRDLFGSK